MNPLAALIAAAFFAIVVAYVVGDSWPVLLGRTSLDDFHDSQAALERATRPAAQSTSGHPSASPDVPPSVARRQVTPGLSSNP